MNDEYQNLASQIIQLQVATNSISETVTTLAEEIVELRKELAALNQRIDSVRSTVSIENQAIRNSQSLNFRYNDRA
jgi:uncharacterized coiled-coil DUF342 family protein